MNGILEKQRIEINQEDEAITLKLCLINNDRVSIPLLKKIDNIGMNNYSNKNAKERNYNNYNNYEIQINELKRKLKEEKDIDKKLINDNSKLKETINILNTELHQLKTINEKFAKDIAQKNIDIPKKKVRNIMICLL